MENSFRRIEQAATPVFFDVPPDALARPATQSEITAPGGNPYHPDVQSIEMPSQESADETQAPTPAHTPDHAPEEPEELFDFAATQTKYESSETRRLLSQPEEVGLTRLVKAGIDAKTVIAQSAETEQPLDSAERQALLRQAADGDRAMEILVQANQGIVKQITNTVRAKFWFMPRVELGELEQQANQELVRAVHKFDPDRGAKFSSYAYGTIAKNLVKWVRDSGRLIRLSRGMSDKVTEFRRLVDSGKKPEDVADTMGYTLETLLDSESKLQRPDAVSYDREASSTEDDSSPLIELLAGASDEEPFTETVVDRVSAQVATSALREWITQRARENRNQADIDPERAYKILLAHFGHGESLADISRQWQISRERVAQLIRATQTTINTKLPDEVAEQIEAAGYSPKSNGGQQS
jgi:RNA polymerase sigma factor (sigma-70 family)